MATVSDQPGDLTWIQGEDFNVNFVYKTQEGTADPVPVDLTGYKLRMDVFSQTSTPTRLYTLNSDELTDPTDATTEATLNADGTIVIAIPRSVTLSGGELYDAIQSGTTFKYDVFLRSPANKQTRLVGGTITVTPSVTLWS